MKIENQRDHTMHIFPRVLNMTQEELVVFPQCFPFPCSLPFSISGIFLPLSKKLKKKKRKNKVLTLYFPQWFIPLQTYAPFAETPGPSCQSTSSSLASHLFLGQLPPLQPVKFLVSYFLLDQLDPWSAKSLVSYLLLGNLNSWSVESWPVALLAEVPLAFRS